MAFMVDSLLKKIFGDRAEEFAADPDFHDYFRQLSTLSGDRLANEPDRLIEENASLQEETENLAYSNYKTFIQAANCSKQIYDDFTQIDGNVDHLLENLPGLSEKCDKFLSEARKINSRRAGNSVALQKHSQILEILEIPQVMDTCVRAGYYEEALSLAQYASKLGRRLGYIPVIKSISDEVSRQKELLLENLLEQLHTGLTLSQCLKVVGYCRRLNAFTEAELRTQFLLARNTWFDNLLQAIPRDDAYQHITKVMELGRVHLFDIITHYRAAFPDDDPFQQMMHVGGMAGGSAGAASEDTLTCNIQAIFHNWLFDRVQKFLAVLVADLDTITRTQTSVSRLDSVMAQCMYFGLSFGRVGADFRALTVPIFEHAVWNFFSNNLDKAYDRLSDDLLQKSRFIQITAECAKMAKYNPSLLAPPPSKSGGDDQQGAAAASSSSSSQPPLSLMEFPPLAYYCNAFLSTLNDLRTCFPITLVTRVVGKLQSNVEDAAKLLMNLKKEFEHDPNLLQSADRAIALLVDDLAPYLNNCLEALFPSKQLAAVLGVNVGEFSQMAQVGRVDLEQLGEIVGRKKPLPEEVEEEGQKEEKAKVEQQNSGDKSPEDEDNVQLDGAEVATA